MTEVNFSGTFRVSELKRGEHTLLIPFDDDSAKLIGRIVVYWGGFELRMDELLGVALGALGKTEPPGWRRFPFKKRKALFKETMAEYTARMAPAEKTTFDKICDTAGDLHWRRNVVAHGYYQMVIGDRGSDGTHEAEFVANAIVKGTTRSVPINPESLQKLWHDISHLAGALMAALARIGGAVGPTATEIIVPDTAILEGQESGNFQTLAIPKKS